jgi:hypothetical protein
MSFEIATKHTPNVVHNCMKTKFLILNIFISNLIFSQSETTLPKKIEPNQLTSEQILQSDIQECESKRIYIISKEFIKCDSIKDKNILPSKYHKDFIRQRIIEIKEKNDTTKITFILFSQCGSEFNIFLECIDSSNVNINICDTSLEKTTCFCPYLISCILYSKWKIEVPLINGNELQLTDKIFNDRIKETTNKNFFNGIKTLSYYYEWFSPPQLILEKKYKKNGNLVSTKMFYLNKEIHE